MDCGLDISFIDSYSERSIDLCDVDGSKIGVGRVQRRLSYF